MADAPKNRRRFWRWTIFLAIAGGASVLALAAVLPCAGPGARAIAQRNACINNLRQIDDAKQRWASETRQSDGTAIVTSEVDQYIRHGAPSCPSGGTYDYGKVGEMPRCSTKDHVL